jgi:hypothetical protein
MERRTLPDQHCGGKEQLIHFQDARAFHNRGFLLALGKARCAFAVNVHTGEFFAVVVIDGHLPVSVLASAVSRIASRPARLRLLHDVISPKPWTMASSRRPRKCQVKG